MDHGNYGSTLDYNQAANQSLQTYFPVGGASDVWIRLSDFRFGQSLRWMAMLACNSLQQDAYQSMKNRHVLPIGDKNQGFTNHLHIILGCKTYSAVSPRIGELWAKKMRGEFGAQPQTIIDAWFNAGKEAYRGQPGTGIFTNTLYFKAVSWNTTLVDKWKSYTNPNPDTDSIGSVDGQVYP